MFIMLEFVPVCIYLVISLLVSLIPLGVPFPFSSNSSTYPEKLLAYKCGFNPFSDARSRFDIQFYLISILFRVRITPLIIPLLTNKQIPSGGGLCLPLLTNSLCGATALRILFKSRKTYIIK